MKNFVAPGNVVTLAAPAAVKGGDGVLVGSLFGVAAYDAAQAADVEVSLTGVFELPKRSTDVVAQGVALYWDAGNSRLTVTAQGNTLVGAAVAGAGNGVATVRVRLNGISIA